jgi:glutamate synthase (NADPH/NADH) large chain/glutamate synthase (ferredoxin)
MQAGGLPWGVDVDRRFPLYRPDLEHDACGVGFVADISGRRSFQVLETALRGVTPLTHRGAVDADAKTGDGAGVTFQVPQRFFRAEAERLGARLDADTSLAVGMVFLPRGNGELAARCRAALERSASSHGLRVFGWREVPVDPSVLGDLGASTRPQIEQVILGPPGSASGDEFERLLYLARKDAEAWAQREGVDGFYVPSLSHRTLVYKGCLSPTNQHVLPRPTNPAFETALAVFTSDTAPTPCQTGSWPSPSGCWPTTEINTLQESQLDASPRAGVALAGLE